MNRTARGQLADAIRLPSVAGRRLQDAKLLPIALLCFLLEIAGPRLASAALAPNQLLGLNGPVAGQCTLFQIDPATGQTESLFAFPLGLGNVGSMVGYPPTGELVFVNAARGTGMDLGEAVTLAFLNPATRQVRQVAITNYPAANNSSGMAYYPPANAFVITAGPANSWTQNHFILADTNGQVLATSAVFPFPDADSAVYNPVTGLLEIVDLNDTTGVQAVSDPFGSAPTYQSLGSTLNDNNTGAPAISPDGTVYVSELVNRTLMKLSGGNFVTVAALTPSVELDALAYGRVPAFFRSCVITNGALVAGVLGVSSGDSVILQTSTNLVQWSALQTNLASGITLTVTNLVDPTDQTRFFRLAVP